MMANNYYTREEVVKMLRQRQGSRESVELAQEIGISPQLMSGIFVGNRQPNEKVLKFLKLRKQVVYSRQ